MYHLTFFKPFFVVVQFSQFSPVFVSDDCILAGEETV